MLCWSRTRRGITQPFVYEQCECIPKTEPTLQQKLSTELHSALGTLVTVLNEANKDPELGRPLWASWTAGVTDPPLSSTSLMQAKGIAAKPGDPRG